MLEVTFNIKFPLTIDHALLFCVWRCPLLCYYHIT